MGLPAPARTAILEWFDAAGRSLDARTARDPYAVWVLETMAQQTQIARAAERWSSFMARFPTIEALAGASPADVLREWKGLGYNRRALNLHRAARTVVARCAGRMPREVADLERLPGIGPYTARAIAAVAFGAAVGPVDTNVRRVLTRMLGSAQAIAPARLQAIADRSVPPERPADWTHALMDLGATVCGPSTPACERCPAARWCRFTRSEARPAAARRRPTAAPPFATTTRWLRGRLLDRLRAAPDRRWVRIPAPIGDHSVAAIDAALGGLARDGLIERHATEARLARLPLA